jgi:hypothetical protein
MSGDSWSLAASSIVFSSSKAASALPAAFDAIGRYG